MTSRRAALKLALAGGLVALSGCSSGAFEAGQPSAPSGSGSPPTTQRKRSGTSRLRAGTLRARACRSASPRSPRAGNSEDTILSALVSGTEPDISTNVFSGFAVQLANLGQVVDLSAIAGYRELIATRHMSGILRSWSVGGRIYALPIYSSPTLIWWREGHSARIRLLRAAAHLRRCLPVFCALCSG